MENNYSIFISYRRENGFETANLIYDRLTRAGYKVFLDCESLRSGKFNEQLYKQIENCKDFLVILPPNSLDRCESEGDWLRLEITHALKHKKNIVPVMLRNFSFPEKLPDDIDELRNYQGIEASQELFNAFIEKLKSLLISKKHLTWQRAKKYVLFILIPLLIAIGVLSYFQIHKNIEGKKEQAQLEQICREEISLMGMEFVKMNNSIIAIEDVHSEWKKFREEISKADPDEKMRIRNEFINYINFKKTQIDMTKPTWKISTLYENVLTKNGIKTEELRVFFSVNHLSEVLDYFDKLKHWGMTPESGWFSSLDEGIDVLTEMNKEMLVGNIYPFIELIVSMPKGVRESYLEVRPMMMKFPDVGFDKTKEELERYEKESYEKLNGLMIKYASLVGEEAKTVEKLQNRLDLLKTKMVTGLSDEAKQRIAAKRDSINKKKELIKAKEIELKEKENQVKQAYEKLLKKCSFEKDEDQWLMWGKILHLAQSGRQAIQMEKQSEKDFVKRKKETGKDSNKVIPTHPTISSVQIFNDVEKLLDLYLSYNKSRDQNALQYVPAAKRYFKLVSRKQIDATGILMVGTENNAAHPVLKTGDVVIERKGKEINHVDDYSKLKDDPSPNVVKILRFNSTGKVKTITEKLPETKVLVGFVNLRENN